MEQNFDIDKIFRETLGNATDVPPGSAWSNLSNELPQGNPSINPNTSGNWFSKLGVISKASIVVSSVVVSSIAIVSIVKHETNSITQQVLDENKHQNIENVNPLNDDKSNKALESSSNEQMNVNNQKQSIGYSLPVLIKSIENDEVDGAEVLIPAENRLNHADVQKNDLNPLADQSKVISEISKKDCNHQLEISQLETGLFADNVTKFSIKGFAGYKQAYVSFGDRTSEKLNLDSNEYIVNHLYKVRNRKTFVLKVNAIGENSCKDSALLKIDVLPNVSKQEEIIPTVFTPNGDGKNDEYFVKIADPIAYKMYVFDMRKNKIFYSENKDENWKGNCGVEPCGNGIYEVILKLKYSGEEEMVITKRINLIRKGN
jgi:hypothetical protein